VYCFHCHGRNPDVPYNTLTSARSRDVIEIEDAPSRSSISTTNQIAPRFGSYNRQGAETLRQSQPLRHNSIRRGSLGGLTTDRSPTAYPAVVSFYMLHYQLSEEEDSEMIAEAISAQLLRTSFRVSSLLFILLIIEYRLHRRLHHDRPPSGRVSPWAVCATTDRPAEACHSRE
jgi:hypothetical protein